jgi:UDP-GlcNAc:undecaprenyl-phosphate GlcNAc-1-phosphate transferase
MLYHAALIALVGTIIAVLVLRDFAPRIGLLDRPDPRKTHAGAVPVVGGIAFGGVFLLTLLAFVPNAREYLPFAAACAVILLTGLADDLKELSSRSKFVGQLAAAVLMTSWGGVYITDLGDLWGTGNVVLRDWAIPFTIFCVIGLLNALNMIDGIDGLAGGIGLVAVGWLLALAQATGHVFAGHALGIFFAALVGFLVFNLRHFFQRRASVFMGDAGSMLLGFVLVWFAVDFTRLPAVDFYAISAVWILGLPIMDTVYLMLRRLLRAQSPFHADRRHIHHTLMYMGLSDAAACWVLFGVAVAFGAVGFFGWYFRVPEPVLTYSFLALFALYVFFMQKWKNLFKTLHIRLTRSRRSMQRD